MANSQLPAPKAERESYNAVVVARKEGALAALEELKRRFHALTGPEGLERCNHVNDLIAQVYWLQHQVKIGELEL
jgi:hypothetical protein